MATNNLTQEQLDDQLAAIRNRYKYHPADTDERVNLHELIRVNFTDFAAWLLIILPTSREASLAQTALQEAAMWSNAAVAIHMPHGGD